MQHTIGVTVTAAVEPMPISLARRGRNGSGPTQVGERTLRSETIRVVTGCDEQGGGDVGADPFDRDQVGRCLGHQERQLCLKGLDLVAQLPMADRERLERQLHRRRWRRQWRARPEGGRSLDQPSPTEPA
jgi:hypothetical protein